MPHPIPSDKISRSAASPPALVHPRLYTRAKENEVHAVFAVPPEVAVAPRSRSLSSPQIIKTTIETTSYEDVTNYASVPPFLAHDDPLLLPEDLDCAKDLVAEDAQMDQEVAAINGPSFSAACVHLHPRATTIKEDARCAPFLRDHFAPFL